MSQVVDVKAWGAVGDGKTDDTAVLNSILDRAANMSSIVYFPFGVYKITDTLLVPVGSRIIGQAWSQIMATGTKFSDELKPRVAVKVGNIGDVGIIEIQSMMFTVSGPTAGVILMQWNVHESTQGSAGMWDSHFRIGGAIGSGLQKNDCPKSGGVYSKCKAASLLLHLSSKSSAYLENIWIWTADHDLDIVSQDQISVYSARGVLVESQGPTWMYGTASEHNVLYQYQLSNAKNIYMGMIQTESPYFQPIPKAPSPFTPGLFPNDPTFRDCGSSTVPCAVSWALRILDSSTIYSMGSGIYSWFADYSQVCLTSETCQQRAVAISESTDVWLYNLVTKGIVEMVSPVNEAATLSASNINGLMASILAWVREEDEVIGAEKFPGFQIYEREALDDLPDLTDPCKTALSQTIHCSPFLERFQYANMGTYIDNTTEADLVCDAACGLSLKSWFDNVSGSCKNQSLGYYDPTSLGGYVCAAYNQTCFKDPTTGQYCREVINNFPVAKDIASMSLATRCSYCFKQKYKMMQASPYTGYDEVSKNRLHIVYMLCFDAGPLDIPTPLYRFPPEPEPICLSETTYTVKYGDTCDTIALQYGVASAALQSGNRELIQDCSRLQPGDVLCLPLSCEKIYTLQDNDTCFSIDMTQDVEYGGTRKYNPWIDMYCSNLQTTRRIIGSVICLSPQGGTSEFVGDNTHTDPAKGNGYTHKAINPPENSTVAEGSAWFCGRWHTAKAGETCATICMEDNIPFGLFLEVNPSLSQADCDGSLKEGLTYCTGPDYFWNDADFWGADWPGSSAGPVDTSTG